LSFKVATWVKLIRQENGNGTYATFSYDSAGRLVQIEYRRQSDDSLLSRFVYSYDAAGNRVQVQEEVLQPDGSWSVATANYGYDQIDRLVSEKRTGSHPYWYEYGYDGSGNRLVMIQRDGSGNVVGQKSYTYDGGNKLLQEVANGVTTVYQYDPNGNTISKTTGTSQVRYYWDDEDKMVRLEDSVVMNFKTDGFGFRRMKEVVGQGKTWFVYDLALSETPGLAPLVAEYDQNGNLVAKYHHDGRGLMAMTRNNSSYWYGFEAIGTTRQLMDGQGQVLDAYAFDAWGNELTSPQSQVPNPFKYVGKHGYYLDTESALMLLGVRYYGNKTGRFVSLDPFKDEQNWYLYAKNNPIVYFDPSGLQAGVGEGAIVIIVIVDPTGLAKVCLIVGGVIVLCTVLCAAVSKLCKIRHPTWMMCPLFATPDPSKAAQRKANKDINPKKCMAFAQNCERRGSAKNCPGGAPGLRFYCHVAFVDRKMKVHMRTYSVNCCACCNIFNEGISCLALHLSEIRLYHQNAYKEALNE